MHHLYMWAPLPVSNWQDQQLTSAAYKVYMGHSSQKPYQHYSHTHHLSNPQPMKKCKDVTIWTSFCCIRLSRFNCFSETSAFHNLPWPVWLLMHWFSWSILFKKSLWHNVHYVPVALTKPHAAVANTIVYVMRIVIHTPSNGYMNCLKRASAVSASPVEKWCLIGVELPWLPVRNMHVYVHV